MVRVSPFVVVLAGASSLVQALPAQEKRAESATNGKTQLDQLTTALQQLADAPTSSTSSLNKNAAYAGAAMLGAVGALIGGAIGAYMPENTTFTLDSIVTGLTSEFTTASAAVDAITKDSGLSIITTLIPKLGALIASQPNLQRGQPNQQGPYIPPPPPLVIPSAPAPKPIAAPAPPVADPMAGMNMAPTTPPKSEAPVPAEPKAPSFPGVATGTASAAFTPSNPAQRGPKPTAGAPPPAAMPGMEGMGGHGHGASAGHGDRRR